MKNVDLLLTANLIVTQNDQREIIKNGAIAIKDGVIVAVGAVEELKKSCKAKEVKNLPSALLMPGLINAHTHLPMTLLRGFADDLPLMEWLTQHIFPMEAHLTPQMLETGTSLACAEMLRTGTTACIDSYLNEKHVYRAFEKSGLRGVFGECIFAFPSLGYQDPNEAYNVVKEQLSEVQKFKHQRIRVSVNPHSVYTTNPAILKKCAELALELNLPLQIHLAETKTETETCLKEHGVRPIELCHQAGLLGKNTTIAHGVDLTDAEIELLVKTQTVVAHNPKSNMKLASGICQAELLSKRGVRLGLGTDGTASNNSLNMFSEMSFCALLQKLATMSPTAMPAGKTLDLATLGGAEALHWEKLGALKVGFAADIIALDLSSPNLNPLHDIISHLVYAASGHEVCMTMVDGQILYENGEFYTLDYPALLKEAEAAKNELLRLRKS